MSMPVVLGREGVVRSIPLELSGEEKEEVMKSAESLKEVIRDAEKEYEQKK